MKIDIKAIFITAGILSVFALVGNFSVVLMEKLTHDQIEINKREILLNNLYQLIDKKQFNNDILEDRITVSDPLLSTKQPVVVYRTYLDGEAKTAIIQAIAPDGYNGSIFLLVGIKKNGTLSGVRVTDHKETPGLGDVVDQKKSDWIFGFDNKSLNNPELEKWQVKKDGGVFDQFSGATISPRAIVKAVKQALQFYEQHKETLFDNKASVITSLDVKEKASR